MPVDPLQAGGVKLEKAGNPGFVSSLSCLSTLSLLQHKLLLGGLQLVPTHDGTGHTLPQSIENILKQVLIEDTSA